jgi:hypothetical protein
MVFQEYGEGGGLLGTAYHWRMGGLPPTRLGSFCPTDVSPDWTTVLILVGTGDATELRLMPIGAGETVTLPRGPIHSHIWGWWHPDGKRILIVAEDVEHQRRLFVQDVAGGVPRRLASPETVATTEGIRFMPDGRFFTVRRNADEPWVLCPFDGGDIKPIPHLNAGDVPVTFGDDERSLFVRDAPGAFPVHVERLDLVTGRREPWLELVPPDLTAVTQPMIGRVWLTPNGRYYAYAYTRRPLDLYLVEGLK